MNKKISLFIVVITFLNEISFGHCQIPCGIYEDAVRVYQIKEDFNTIKKAMYNIKDLQKKENALSLNQSIRWINTKEEHAKNIQDRVSQYFLIQRIKTYRRQIKFVLYTNQYRQKKLKHYNLSEKIAVPFYSIQYHTIYGHVVFLHNHLS